MSAKKNLSEVYRYLEILVALLVTITILYVRMDSKLYDRASYIDLWSWVILGMAFVFFISLPILLIYLVSFFRAIPFHTIWQKSILAIHLLNIALWLVLYLILPKPLPCNATIMEQHYLSHQQEIHDLIAYTKGCLNDFTQIHYETRGGDVTELFIDRFSSTWSYDYMRTPSDVDSILFKVGITSTEFDTIKTKMEKAGLIGININRNGFDTYSYLTYRWYGETKYLYGINHHPEQKDDVDLSFDCITYNDSIKFMIPHGFGGGHGFEDSEKFLKNHPAKN